MFISITSCAARPVTILVRWLGRGQSKKRQKFKYDMIDKTRQNKTRQGKARQDKARQDTTKQDKDHGRRDKARHEFMKME